LRPILAGCFAYLKCLSCGKYAGNQVANLVGGNTLYTILNRTKIHITKKLEALVKSIISIDKESESGILGKWNATVFYVERKKCWLVTNGYTKYNFILADIKSSDLSNIESIFKESLFNQLQYDGIKIEFNKLNEIISELDFAKTDNDRSTIGFQNQNLYLLDLWKNKFKVLENMPLKDLTNRINTTPIHIGKGRKMSDYTTSFKEMKQILEE